MIPAWQQEDRIYHFYMLSYVVLNNTFAIIKSALFFNARK